MNSARDIRVLLHDIRSRYNVGAMLRTADAVGTSRIYFSGYTPAPIDRFGFSDKEIAKTALGAERFIPWEKVSDPSECIASLKKEGFTIVGLEQDTRSKDYKTFMPSERTLILVGSEVEGLTQSLRDACDILLEIPMKGEKESLNVSVSFGVLLYRLFDR